MKKEFIALFTMYLLLLSLSACSKRSNDDQKKLDTLKQTLPTDLMFEGAPIDAAIMCRLGFGDSSRFDAIDIRDWMENKRIEECKTPENEKAIITPLACNDGFIGHEIQYPEDPNPYYNHWKYIGTIHGTGNRVIEAISGYAGRSYRSNIFLVSRKGDVIQNVGEFTGGDRGHWGIVTAALTNDSLSIWQNITARAMFLECLEILAKDNEQEISLTKDQQFEIIESIKYHGKIIPLNDLSDSFINWEAEILTEWKNSESREIDWTREIVGIHLEEDYQGTSNDFADNAKGEGCRLLQQCFDETYKAYLKKQEDLNLKCAEPSYSKVLNKVKMAQFAKDVLDLYLSFNPPPIDKPQPTVITKNIIPGISPFVYLNIVELAKEQMEKSN